LINAERLRRMKRSAVLINTARGPVVDEAALVSALSEGRIAAAGLDVYEDEPRVHPGLLQLDNVVLLPHLGSATVETRTAMGMRVAANLEAYFSGQPLRDPVV
jgi:lactate dehydrogenase-like 2-hydroxyacid dehydrogenase